MRFIKDILLFDMETTGEDPEKDAVIQLSAVLLDKDNLLEKGIFNSYVKTSLLENTIAKHAHILKISPDIIKKSNKAYDCLKKFTEQFPAGTALACQGPKQFIFLRNSFKKISLPFPYDFHPLDLWTISYNYVMKSGLSKTPSFHTLLDYFKLKQKNPHNALERARLEAEILRKILKNSK